MASIRYLVHDVEKAIGFYTGQLGFKLIEQYGPAMAILERGDLTLWVAGPPSSAAKPMPNGEKPTPGGWSRFVLEVTDLAATVATLRSNGVQFRNEITTGPGGSQILIEDPSGNPIELFSRAQ